MELLVANGLVATPSGSIPLDIGVRGGRVVALFEPGTAPLCERTIDAGGLRVLPGFIDAHFHCSGVPDPEREDMQSATAAAAAGGTTTVFQMPVFEPFRIRDRAEAAQRQAHVDIAFWGMGGATTEEIHQAAEDGAIGFKIFMIRPTADISSTADRRKLQVGSGVEFVDAFRLVASTGRRAAIHCEDQWIIDAIEPLLRAQGRKDPFAHQDSRPPLVEAAAVAKVLALAGHFQARVHITHISSNGVIPLLAEARRQGIDVSAETCPHYLCFTSEIMKQAGPFARITPPIRSAAESDALWPALREGTIDMVSSDHSPWPLAEKLRGWDDIFMAPPGAPGAELRGPAVLTAAAEGRISFERAVEVLSTSCARTFGLYPRKGAIVPGADADLVLFDPAPRWTVKAAEMVTGARNVAMMFEGMTMQGRITETILRGKTVYKDGKVVGASGDGRPLLFGTSREPALSG